MAQYLVPSADDTDGSWTNQADSAVDLFQSVNEGVGEISDVDYIQSADPPVDDTVLLKLATGSRPGAGTARLRLRGRWAAGPPPATTEVAFVWEAVTNANNYKLRVGPTSGVYTTFDALVGNVLTYYLNLEAGSYVSIVEAYQDTTWLQTTGEQSVVVT